jgi:N,N'-diacetyllegionaminate synthase
MISRRPVTIIAEAAQGFEGDARLARLLVRAAAVGRADMVKFQLVYADELATPDYSYYGLFKKLEMGLQKWQSVATETNQAGIGLAFDVFGPQSLDLALTLQAAAVKVHAADFFNQTLVSAALEEAPRVFFSVGGISVDEIGEFIERCDHATLKKLTLLYGFQNEPTATSDNNLRRLAVLRARFPTLDLGFMDHADGDSDEAGWLGMLALPFGVTLIEKHITLDRSLQLEDYVSAVNSEGFARYVARIRAAEVALGNDDLELSPAELDYRNRAIKLVVAARTLERGRLLGEDDVRLLRAARDGDRKIFRRTREVCGRRLVRSVTLGRPIYAEDLE